jgi:hypothetical protein
MRKTFLLTLLTVFGLISILGGCSGDDGPSVEELRALGTSSLADSFEENWDLQLFKTNPPDQKRGNVLILEPEASYDLSDYTIKTGAIEGPNLIPVSIQREDTVVWREWLPPTWLYFPDNTNQKFYVLIYDFFGDQGLKEILFVDLEQRLTQGLRVGPTLFPDDLENRDLFYATDINFDWTNALVISFGVNYRSPTDNEGINAVWKQQLGDLLGKDSPMELGYWVVRP